MATLKQILKAHGFQHKSSTTYREQWKLRHNRKWTGKSYVSLDIRSYERNASMLTMMIGGKKSEMWFGYNDNHSANTPNEEQLARFEALVIRCKAAALYEEANPVEKAPRKPVPPRPTLTEEEKFDNRIWRWLGEFHVCSFIGKEMRQELYYYKAGNYIRVEDNWRCMAYANVRARDLKESGLPLTLATFEEWLQAKGVKKKAQKRVKRSYSLYD